MKGSAILEARLEPKGKRLSLVIESLPDKHSDVDMQAFCQALQEAMDAGSAEFDKWAESEHDNTNTNVSGPDTAVQQPSNVG